VTNPTVLDGEASVRAAIGSNLGTSEWIEITQERLDQFATATGDQAGRYLAVSLSNMFLPQIVEVRGFAMGINYGTDEVRLGADLKPGDRVRATASLVDVTDVKGGIQTRMSITVEVHGDDPACTIESLSRWLL
jgi:acyl dehydratase